jgi:Dyggve-Melchior-Clausen syndrome protein
MLDGRKDPSKVGLMYLCTFTLLKLSGERSFGVALNQPYQLTLPVDVPPFTGGVYLIRLCNATMVWNGCGVVPYGMGVVWCGVGRFSMFYSFFFPALSYILSRVLIAKVKH